MKKIMTLILVIILVFISGCTQEKMTQKELEQCYKNIPETSLSYVEFCYKDCCEKKDFFERQECFSVCKSMD